MLGQVDLDSKISEELFTRNYDYLECEEVQSDENECDDPNDYSDYPNEEAKGEEEAEEKNKTVKSRKLAMRKVRKRIRIFLQNQLELYGKLYKLIYIRENQLQIIQNEIQIMEQTKESLENDYYSDF